MKIAIGADHRGFDQKEFLKQHIDPKYGIAWVDVGADSMERSDFPVFAKLVSKAILNGDAELGIMLCGSGIGMAIMANRYPRIYAALVWNEAVSQKAREHNNANVLVIPSDFVTKEQLLAMVDAWLRAQFNEGRYQHRIDMIDAL